VFDSQSSQILVTPASQRGASYYLKVVEQGLSPKQQTLATLLLKGLSYRQIGFQWRMDRREVKRLARGLHGVLSTFHLTGRWDANFTDLWNFTTVRDTSFECALSF